MKLHQKCPAIIILTLTLFLPTQSSAATIQAKAFRSILLRFSIDLPAQPSEYRDSTWEIAKYRFPTREYWWTIGTDDYGIISGSGINDLEFPEYTKLFLNDFKAQFAAARAKERGTLIDEESWSFEGHPGLRQFYEMQGRWTELRVFLVKNRFFVLRAEFNPDQLVVSETQTRTLESFKFLSDVELAEEKENLIDWFAPNPLPQAPFINQQLSDAQIENLRDKVKQVTEELKFPGRIPIGEPYAKVRKEFNDQGYLLTKVEYDSQSIPTRVYRYGYLNNARVYTRTARMGLPEFPVRKSGNSVMLFFEVQRRFGKLGQLEQERIIKDRGESTDTFSYSRKDQRLQISVKSKWKDQAELRVSETSIETNPQGDPRTEEISEYFPAVDKDYKVLEQAVNSYEVVNGALKGRNALPPTGPIRTATATEIAKDPNLTVKVLEAVPTGDQRKLSEFSYYYSYQYDSHGNWIKRTTFLVEKSQNNTVKTPIKATYRTITYY